AEARTTVGSVNDPMAVRAALRGVQAVVYLAMGVGPVESVEDVDAAFGVNAKGVYRVYAAALAAGVRRFVHASTLSVYEGLTDRMETLDEATAPNAWRVYGITKRMGEMVCETAAERFPDAGIV